jgi:hypothetical protein
MAETADAEDGDQVGRPRARDLHGLVGRHARAGQRRSVEWVDAVRDGDDVLRVRVDVLGEPAVHRITGVLLRGAERLPAAHAVVTGAARISEPRNGDAVADRQLGHARAESSTMPTPS